MVKPVFLPHEQQVFWEFYLKWFYVLLVCFHLPPPLPILVQMGRGEVNWILSLVQLAQG